MNHAKLLLLSPRNPLEIYTKGPLQGFVIKVRVILVSFLDYHTIFFTFLICFGPVRSLLFLFKFCIDISFPSYSRSQRTDRRVRDCWCNVVLTGWDNGTHTHTHTGIAALWGDLPCLRSQPPFLLTLSPSFIFPSSLFSSAVLVLPSGETVYFLPLALPLCISILLSAVFAALLSISGSCFFWFPHSLSLSWDLSRSPTCWAGCFLVCTMFTAHPHFLPVTPCLQLLAPSSPSASSLLTFFFPSFSPHPFLCLNDWLSSILLHLLPVSIFYSPPFCDCIFFFFFLLLISLLIYSTALCLAALSAPCWVFFFCFISQITQQGDCSIIDTVLLVLLSIPCGLHR